MVLRAGLEPTTLCLEGRCSIQLSYRSTYCKSAISSIIYHVKDRKSTLFPTKTVFCRGSPIKTIEVATIITQVQHDGWGNAELLLIQDVVAKAVMRKRRESRKQYAIHALYRKLRLWYPRRDGATAEGKLRGRPPRNGKTIHS